MRDFETIAAALTIAETGHLVLRHCIQTMPHNQSIELLTFSGRATTAVRLQLSNVIEAVFHKD